MKLIADSGSTTTDWRLADNEGEIHQYTTIGLNPYFLNTNEISDVLETELISKLNAEHITEVYYYGAGCSNKTKCKEVEEAIQNNFKEATISVDHDLLGAARALFGNEEGIAAILGTGSNSCYYNGGEIIENRTALSYVLGDEGSGAYMGKKFISDYLNKELPEDLCKEFEKGHDHSVEEILDSVYVKPLPNRYLASFTKFLHQNLQHSYVFDLVNSVFDDFFDMHICKYERHKEVVLGCVGSVGFYFSSSLKEAASRKEVAIGKIIESPIAALTSYHTGLE